MTATITSAKQINKSNLFKVAHALVKQCGASLSDALKASWAYYTKKEGIIVDLFKICRELFPSEAPVTKFGEAQAEYIKRNQEAIASNDNIRPFVSIVKQTEKAICFLIDAIWVKKGGKKSVQTEVWFPKSQVSNITETTFETNARFLDAKRAELADRNLYF